MSTRDDFQWHKTTQTHWSSRDVVSRSFMIHDLHDHTVPELSRAKKIRWFAPGQRHPSLHRLHHSVHIWHSQCRCLARKSIEDIEGWTRKWVCLKIGYIPHYSHLIGIMIINHWV
jgi:hypothetical protein